MTDFKKVVGSYTDVVRRLHLPDEYYMRIDEGTYRQQIQKDVRRTAYLSMENTVWEIQQKFVSNISDLEGNLSYQQGNLDGGAISVSHVQQSPKFNDFQMNAEEEGTLEGAYGSFRVAYIEDAGKMQEAKHSALAITYLRDDSDRSIPVEDRKRIYSVAIINDTNAPPEKRTVTYLCHPDLLDKTTKTNGKVRQASILSEIKKATHSEALNALLTDDLFVGDSISSKHLNALKARFHNNQNLDNRDEKQAMLHELLRVAAPALPPDYVQEIEARAASELDFFKEGHFQETVAQIYETAKQDVSHSHSPVKKEALDQSELTLIAIQLELAANRLKTKADHHLLNAMREQAEMLRSMRDDPQQRTIEDISYRAQIKTAANTAAFTRAAETLQLFSSSVEQLTPRTHKDNGLNFYSQKEALQTIALQKSENLDQLDMDGLSECHLVFATYRSFIDDPEDGAKHQALKDLVPTIKDPQLKSFVQSSLQVVEREKENIVAEKKAMNDHYVTNLTHFSEKLSAVDMPHCSEEEKDFYSQGSCVLNCATEMLALDPSSLPQDIYDDLNRMVQCATRALENPGDKINNNALMLMASKFTNTTSPRMQTLGLECSLFTGLAKRCDVSRTCSDYKSALHEIKQARCVPEDPEEAQDEEKQKPSPL